MHPFVETLSVVGAIAIVIVLAIAVLTVFFGGWSKVSDGEAKAHSVGIRGVLKKGARVTAHLQRDVTLERVRFMGFARGLTKSGMPYEFHGMVIFEDEERQRYLVRARLIRMIVVLPDDAAP
ncbi:MAG: hypothetical protein JNG90_04140 [Planctomycetaceae bacterium]|nr:hypothetical protein [Planctomycetaceae bacterium]